MKKFFVIVLAFCLIIPPAVSFAEHVEDGISGEAMIADTLVFRPFGFASLVIGSTMFVISLPIAVITGSVDRTYQGLVKDPFHHTFVRSVGNLDYRTRE
jgi:hypothetical protein